MIKKIERIFSRNEGRPGRYDFVRKNFPEIFSGDGKILDVGCDENYLKKTDLRERVFGIDIGGAPDLKVNLETEALRVFGDKSYETVLCFEVLEHIDNLHEIASEIGRVSSRWALISIPNSTSFWRTIKLPFIGRTTGKYYGLPILKPADRHKWFFSYKDAEKFFLEFPNWNGMEAVRLVRYFNRGSNSNLSFFAKLKTNLITAFIRLFRADNFCDSVFCLLERK